MNTLITLASIFLLVKVFHFNPYGANFIGYILGLCNSFICNSLFTFKHKLSLFTLIKFLLVFVLCYLLQLGALYGFAHILRVNMDISQILSLFFYTVVGYFLNHFWVFRGIP